MSETNPRLGKPLDYEKYEQYLTASPRYVIQENTLVDISTQEEDYTND